MIQNCSNVRFCRLARIYLTIWNQVNSSTMLAAMHKLHYKAIFWKRSKAKYGSEHFLLCIWPVLLKWSSKLYSPLYYCLNPVIHFVCILSIKNTKVKLKDMKFWHGEQLRKNTDLSFQALIHSCTHTDIHTHTPIHTHTQAHSGDVFP